MPSNHPRETYQQLVDCLERLRAALDTRDFEALDRLVQDQNHLVTILQSMGHSMEDQIENLDADILAQAHVEVVHLLAEAQRQQAALAKEFYAISNKRRHIATYCRNQF